MTVWTQTLGAGPDLVLLHGWGMNAGVWQPVLAGLAERFRVTLIELPGHGESDLPSDADSLVAWADACVEVAPDHAVWMGWSLGGLVAQQVAIQAPQNVAALRLIASTPSFVQREAWPNAMPGKTFEQFADALLADPAATLKRFLGLQVKGEEHARETLRALNEALAERPAASMSGLQSGLGLLLTGDLRSRLRELKLPVDVLLGQRDTLVPVSVQTDLRDQLPHARVEVVEKCGHAPFLSHPYEFLQWMDH